jgi:tetratricopeptide (TPR) repeat protein
MIVLAGEFQAAIDAYTAALKALSEPTADCAALYSNRSAAYERLSQFAEALSDGDCAVSLRPAWDKV